jgi:hypothetical protein
MRRLIAPLVLLAAGAARPAAAATPPPETLLLPANSVMVVGFDVRGFFASRLWAQIKGGGMSGQLGLTPEKAAELSKEIQQSLATGMADMEKEMGFRADRDLDWIVFAMRNPQAPSPEMVAVATGRFDAARIVPLVAASFAKEGTLKKKAVGGTTIQWSEKGAKPGPAMAVASNGLILFGDAPLVEEALGAHTARRRPFDANVALAQRVKTLAGPAGVFLFAGETLFQELGQSKTPPPIPLPRSLGMTFEFDGGSELTAEMTTEKDAQEAATMLQGQLAMIGAMMAQDPDPQKAGMGKLLSGFTAQAQGKMLRVTGSASGGGLSALLAAAIPSMMRARSSANESAAIGDLRSLVSAQAAYSSVNEGVYGELPCLSTPASCMKGYTGPVFLDAKLTSLETKSGYRRAFHAGRKAARARSVDGFAYTAMPLEPGKSGTRSFCIDASGVIRVDPKGGDIRPVGGECPPSLEVLK